MVSKSFIKNILREFRQTPARFIALFLILVLSSAFYTGLRCTAPTMRETADEYFASTQLRDFRLMSNMGITEDDIIAFQSLPEVERAVPGYALDLLVSGLGGEPVCTLRSLPKDSSNHKITELRVLEGTLPSSENECIIDEKSILEIGDKLVISDQNKKKSLDILIQHEFTIVGKARSPEFISHDRGHTTIGNGELSFFVYVPESAFDSEYFGLVDIYLKKTQDTNSAFSAFYINDIDRENNVLETLTEERAQIRYDDIMKEAGDKIADGEKKLKKAKKKADDKLADARVKLEDAQTAISDAKIELKENEKKLKDGEKELKKGKAEISKQEKSLAEAQQQYDAAIASGIPAEMMTEAKAKIDAGKKAIAGAKKKLAASEKELNDGKTALAEGKEKIESSEKELSQGWSDFETEKDKAYAKIDKAERKLEKSRAKLDDIKIPKWHILTRDDMPGYSGFADDADRIDSISLTITTFLYLVAALVCLTTMTRMVEEQRLFIGTMKALGFRRRTIVSKYFAYAVVLSAVGGGLGAAIGLRIFPASIWSAYSIMYRMDPMQISVRPSAVVIGIFGGVLAVSIATTAACLGELRSPAAELMRPKAPKPGRRVLLERIGPLWRRLRFSDKVTARNLFRYKKRLIMTVIGIMGCSALLLAGAGIHNSITGIGDLQYGVVNHYDATFYLDKASDKKADTSLNKTLNEYGENEYYMEKAVDAKRGNKAPAGMPIEIFVPENPEVLNDFISFRIRGSGEHVVFPPEGYSEPSAVVTEKLAKELGAGIGDKISFGEPGKPMNDIIVAGITENYIYSYIYMTPGDYEKIYGKAPVYKAVMLKMAPAEDGESGQDEEDINNAITHVLEDKNAVYAVSAGYVRSMVRDIVSNLSVVVWVIIGVSGLLALIVLYNLTNINVTERERELATLKVLGFYRKEVSAYISRETIILTVIGVLFGFIGGILLHRYLISAVEVNDIMFARLIKPFSFIFTGAFTIVCAIVIMLIMQPKLNRIDPVTSLKSAE